MSTPAPRPVEGQQAPTRRSSEGDAGITEHGDTKIHIGNMLPDDGNRPEFNLTTFPDQLEPDGLQFSRLRLSSSPLHAPEPSYILPPNQYAQWQDGPGQTSPYSHQPNWGPSYHGIHGSNQIFPPRFSPATPHSAYYPQAMYGRPPAGQFHHSQQQGPAVVGPDMLPFNPSPPHLSRPSTAQTQVSYHTGEYASPPISPVLDSQNRVYIQRNGSTSEEFVPQPQGFAQGHSGVPPSAWQQQPQFVYYPIHAGAPSHTQGSYGEGNSASQFSSSSEGWRSVAVSPVMASAPLVGGGWGVPMQAGWNQYHQPPQRHFVPRPPPSARPFGSFQYGIAREHGMPQGDAFGQKAASMAGHGNGEGEEKERERKAYHPQPPAKRSEWVMWVGNVPNNVSHEELWRFFTSMIPPPLPTTDPSSHWLGPSSIFLISRSSCAFVNLSSADDLDRAVTFFNGRSLRPWDIRCPRLVCRVRKKDDDLRAGVGGQRGMGMHRAWVKGQAVVDRPADIKISSSPREDSDGHTPQNGEGLHTPMSQTEQSTSSSVPPSPAAVLPPDGEGRRRESLLMYENERKERERLAGGKHQSTGSNASTNSSFLVRHFPKRYFILKSMTTADLQASVQSGTWSTQKHNEPILDQAFRTSPEVYLIFSANRSGEFFGYARMTEASNKHDRRNMAWQAHHSEADSKDNKRPLPSKINEEADEAGAEPAQFLLSPSPVHVASSSPSEITPAEDTQGNSEFLHAPGERRTDPHQWAASPSLVDVGSRAATLDPNALRPKPKSYFPSMSKIEFGKNNSDPHLDAPPVDTGEDEDTTPINAVAQQQAQGSSDRSQTKDDAGVLRKDTLLSPKELQAVRGEPALDAEHAPLVDGQADSWGAPFSIEWIRVGGLPFTRLRHLRNPWNGDKEVKVSRDGTEVEPSVGAQLLAEWDNGPAKVPHISYSPHMPSSVAEQSSHAIRT